MKRIEIKSQVTLKNMNIHHISMKNFFIENTEDNFETHATLEMKQRESTDGCLNYEDIEIRFQNVFAIQNSIKHENKYLVAVEEETISTSPSPLELHEVGPSKKEEDEEVLERSLKMNENKIQEAFSILHDTQALVSNS